MPKTRRGKARRKGGVTSKAADPGGGKKNGLGKKWWMRDNRAGKGGRREPDLRKFQERVAEKNRGKSNRKYGTVHKRGLKGT